MLDEIEKLEKELQKERNDAFIHTKIASKDRVFYIIALNLSGRREELEDKAFKLIEEIGLLNALKRSRI